MKIEDSVGYICEFSDEETSMIRQIAERDKLTLENALAKAIQNFNERNYNHEQRRTERNPRQPQEVAQ